MMSTTMSNLCFHPLRQHSASDVSKLNSNKKWNIEQAISLGADRAQCNVIMEVF